MEYVIKPALTYKTRENAMKALVKKTRQDERDNLMWSILTHTDGRFFPVFFGADAVHAGMHFRFNIIAF